MNILVTIGQGRALPGRVLLESLFLNNPGERFTIFLIAEDLSAWDFSAIATLCVRKGHTLRKIPVGPALLQGAPSLHYYPKTMYYRLLAAELLPDGLERALYLDPDLLIINPIRPLYDLEMENHLFAAAAHRSLLHGEEGYCNAGVLLLNLPRMRSRVCAADILRYANAYQDYLILPDRDILNGLYGAEIVRVDDSIWNYDTRKHLEYRLASQGVKDMKWVMDNTACLHFCGRNKPWREGYTGPFGPLYTCYEQALRGVSQENPANRTGVL